MFLGDLCPEMHEGILFFCTATHPFFGLVHFWYSFMGSLAGCEVLLHFLACRRSREDGSPFAVTFSHVAMLSYQSGLVKVWAPNLFLHRVNDEDHV